jgi:hypothetical protein
MVDVSKFLYLYRGPATPMVGPAMVEFGNPFGARTAVADDGTTRAPGDLNGYSIVEADSLDAATALTEKHPFLSEGKGRFAIEVFELAPM